MATNSSCASDSRVNLPTRAGNAHQQRVGRVEWGRRWLFLLCYWGMATSARPADGVATLAIGVRSTVTQPPGVSPSSVPSGHNRLYAVLTVDEVTSAYPLAKPVDEGRLIDRLHTELSAHGFKRAAGQERPEILLTVVYGRGWLRNPYLAAGVAPIYDTYKAPVFRSSNGWVDMAAQSIAGLTNPYIDEISPGREAALQKASYEKLFLRVTAFAFNNDPRARAQLLWMTTMIVDDPSHRDLNLIAPQMLAAGAHYFARAMTEKEVTFTAAAPTARVYVGTPEVVGEAAVASVPAAAPATVAPPPLTFARKQFDLPPGEAAAALQAFSRQSGEQILYPAEQVRAVRTRAVSGEFSAHEALERMLDQTGLVAVWDEKSGIVVIRRSSR